jgi:hypothetical protein
MNKKLKVKLFLISLASLLILVIIHIQLIHPDFNLLINYLQRRDWYNSDIMTAKIIDQFVLDKIDKESFIGYSRLDFLNLIRTRIIQNIGTDLCEELKQVDRIWLQNTNQTYGLSIQAKLLEGFEDKRGSINFNILLDKFSWSSFEIPPEKNWFVKENLSNGSLPTFRWMYKINSEKKLQSIILFQNAIRTFRIKCLNKEKL